MDSFVIFPNTELDILYPEALWSWSKVKASSRPLVSHLLRENPAGSLVLLCNFERLKRGIEAVRPAALMVAYLPDRFR